VCGIAGLIRFDGRAVRTEEIQAMTDAIAHRGPDDQGLFLDRNVGIGMRRLSIVDLSPAGHQPLFNEDGAVVVVYNGEIYNHRDIRSRLVADGHHFRGHSDTEVLVHGYEELGARELASRLQGMFAFALLDRARRRLYLARDGFGIKPLYLRVAPGQISFASELRALHHDGLGAPAIDPSFVGTFLRLGYVPSPASAFAGVEKLPPGTLCEIDLDSGQQRRAAFYRLRPGSIEHDRPDDLLERLRELLNGSVRRHLMADVPTGLFLSGGLDSSALTFFANHHGPPLETFSVGFSASDRGDETPFAAEVARRAGNANVAFDLGPANLDDLTRIVGALEEPLADSAALPLWYLCKGTVRRVKVALSGEGGDEVLGGYARYFWGPVVDQLRPFVAPHAETLTGLMGRLPSRSLGVFNVARRTAKLADSIQLDTPMAYLAWFDIFSAAERNDLVGPGQDLAAARFESLFAEAAALGLGGVQRLQYIDIHTMLLDNLLLKADKISMAHSLEVRVPFLDRALVEFGLALPQQAKIGARGNKRLLRRLLRPLMGGALSRRPKRGFEIPVDRWFREPATEPLRARLRQGALVRALGFRARAIEDLLARHLAGQDVGRKLFALTALERWAERYA
jgi:asparagine synthase (glutamine-hydrolysing)